MAEDEEQKRQDNLVIHQRLLRDTMNPFDIREKRFQALYRFDRATALRLVIETARHMESPRVPLTIRVFAALHYFVNGSYQPEFSRILYKSQFKNVCMVANALHKMAPKWINFPKPDEYDDIKQVFFKKTGFPDVIGAVDCTHMRIKKPNQQSARQYLNKAGFYSIKVQMVCDFNLKITDAVAYHGGATRDVTIWDKTRANAILKNRYKENKEVDSWLLGDSHYKLLPWLLIPYHGSSDANERRYNRIHKKARRCTYRLSRTIKMEFRCLQDLNTTPQNARKIISACTVLHNMRLVPWMVEKNWISEDEVMDEDKPENESVSNELQQVGHSNEAELSRQRVKANICVQPA